MCSVTETNLIDIILHTPEDSGDINNYAGEVENNLDLMIFFTPFAFIDNSGLTCYWHETTGGKGKKKIKPLN